MAINGYSNYVLARTLAEIKAKKESESLNNAAKSSADAVAAVETKQPTPEAQRTRALNRHQLNLYHRLQLPDAREPRPQPLQGDELRAMQQRWRDAVAAAEAGKKASEA